MATISRKPFSLGGREFKLAALSFRQLDDLKPEVDLLMSSAGTNFANAEVRAAAVKVGVASFARAGEAVDSDFLIDNLDTVNFPDLIVAVFARNGFLAKEGEQGEATAATSST